MNKKPLVRREFIIEDEDALKAISIVKDPAIEKSFQMFRAANLHDNCKCEIVDGELITEATACDYCKSKKSSFKAVIEKQQLTGPAMVPNKDILRIDETTGEYYNCWFSPETIVKASSLYLKNSHHTSANFDHQELYTNKVYIIESWIVEDPENDKSKALGFSDITKGTWMVTYQVDDAELWSEIKANGFTGFSIEGFFEQFDKQLKDDALLNKIYSIINSNIPDSDKENMIKTIINTI